MNFKNIYDIWLKNVKDVSLIDELNSIKNNEKEQYERFYKSLEFGTAGIREIMGVGTNRLNIYTIRKVSQGISNYLNQKYDFPSISISYDSRNNSHNFAISTAEVFAGNGIKVYLVKELQPTPFLSFATRYLKCNAGIMITASHNTSEYNGYKCYDSDGAQITENQAKEIQEFISKIDIFNDVKSINLNEALSKGIISYVDNMVYDEYLNNVIKQRVLDIDCSDLNVVYTPLNGCGNKLVCKSIKRIVVNDFTLVKEQELPDGNFTTCKNPNPEKLEVFDLAIKDAKNNNADIVIATDPDADRLGLCVKHNDEYKLLTGNQIGTLLFYYIIKNKKNIIKNPVIIKSIVSTKMVNAIAKKFNCEVIEVFTGFKNIAKEISKLENKNQLSRYILGFEESNGYLCGTYARDKDAISATILVCEMTSYFKKQGLTLIDVYKNLSKEYGYYNEKTIGMRFDGSEGMSKINNIVSKLRLAPPKFIGSYKIQKFKDYLVSNNPQSETTNMISMQIDESNEVIIRPSGTEPKLKIYILANDINETSLQNKITELSDSVKKLINNLT